MTQKASDQKWLRHILDSKSYGEYYFKHVQFHFSDRTTYNLWKKTKVGTLSAVCTKNVKNQLQGMLAVF
jgi:hypothetical protein